jgi:hypothetical protein
MDKRYYAILTLLVTAILVAATPAILQVIPDRYVARWVPEILQPLALPETGPAVLPTLVPVADASQLLLSTAVPNIPPTFTPPAEPPTPTAVSAVDEPTVVPTDTPFPTATPPPTPTPLPIPSQARLTHIAHQFQEWNNCGPATLAMTLSYFDLRVTQNDTAAILKPNPEDRNVTPEEMVDYVNNQTPVKAIFRTNGNHDTLLRLVANGIPVIVEVGIEPPGEYRWLGWYGHYLLVVAYDDVQQQYWVYDSWFGTSAEPLTNAHADGRILPYADLDTYWPHFNRNYIALYRPEQAQFVAGIIGEDMDDAIMWQNSLNRAQADAATDPENGFFWFNLGKSYNAIGDYEKAASAFDQALAISLPWRMLWYQFGPYEAYYQVGRYEDVILLADTTLKDRPYFEESFYYKGLALAALGDTTAARQSLEDAVDFNSNYAPALAALNNLGG